MSLLPLRDLHILVLEDEFIIALDLESLCRDHGAADVTVCASIDELGSDPFSLPFNLAIVDVMLGGMPTLDFARQLEERGIPFVFATGYSASEGMLRDFPDVPVVTKPFSPESVIQALSQATRRTEDLGNSAPRASGGVRAEDL